MNQFWRTRRNLYYGGHFIEASFGMVFQVCFWERRKLQLVAACASKPIVARYSLALWGTIEVQVCDRNSYYRGGPPQNGSEISTVYGSRNCPCKYIRFGATLRNDRDNFSPSPAFAGLRFQNFRKKRKPGQPPKQICRKPKETRKNLGKPSANWKPAWNLRNPAETLQTPMQKPWKSAETLKTPHKMLGNPAETLRKPCGNPRKLAGNLRKPSETLRKPCGNPRKPLHSPFGN